MQTLKELWYQRHWKTERIIAHHIQKEESSSYPSLEINWTLVKINKKRVKLQSNLPHLIYINCEIAFYTHKIYT